MSRWRRKRRRKRKKRMRRGVVGKEGKEEYTCGKEAEGRGGEGVEQVTDPTGCIERTTMNKHRKGTQTIQLGAISAVPDPHLRTKLSDRLCHRSMTSSPSFMTMKKRRKRIVFNVERIHHTLIAYLASREREERERSAPRESPSYRPRHGAIFRRNSSRSLLLLQLLLRRRLISWSPVPAELSSCPAHLRTEGRRE